MAHISVVRKNLVLYLTLSRPEAHNALSSEMIKGITQTFKALKKDTTVRAVVLSGDGPSFCAGGDLNWMREALKFNLSQNIKDARTLSEMYESIFQCPVPVLAYVHGNIMGGGVGLAAVCDIVAAEGASKFCLSEVRLGLVPSIISPYVLRKIPESHARPLMLTAEIFSASHAKDIQLAHFVGSKEEGQKYIAAKLDLIAHNGPEATRITKGLIQKVKTASWKVARDFTVKTIAQRRVSKEGQEGVHAFFEKRDPTWRKL